MAEDITTNIYILKLVEDKYYVGKSDNVPKTFLEIDTYLKNINA